MKKTPNAKKRPMQLNAQCDKTTNGTEGPKSEKTHKFLKTLNILKQNK